MPRLFTGLAIPSDIAAALAPFRGGLPGARWIDPADYHVTLRFLGDVSRDLAEDAVEALSRMRSRPAIEIVFEGLSVFGGDRPRAVLAAIVPTAELIDLQAEQERLIRRAGAAPEGRRFRPHVTLARLRREATTQVVASYLSQTSRFPPLRFTATDVVLYSARDSSGGGPYRAEFVFPVA